MVFHPIEQNTQNTPREQEAVSLTNISKQTTLLATAWKYLLMALIPTSYNSIYTYIYMYSSLLKYSNVFYSDHAIHLPGQWQNIFWEIMW